MTYTDLLVDRDGGVLRVTFNRPEKLNAIRQHTLRELVSVLEDAASDEGVRVVVFTGAGRAFTAGDDIGELDEFLSGNSQAAVDHVDAFQDITRRMQEHPKLMVAAINGIAVGFGAEMALSCDVRVCSTKAKIGFVEARRGMFQTNGVTWLLPRLVGHGNATHLLLTGELIDGAEAHRIGFATRVAEPGELEAIVGDLATQLSANAPLTLARVKEAMRRTWTSDLDDMMRFETEAMVSMLDTEDLSEGNRAFLKKREPVYRGR